MNPEERITELEAQLLAANEYAELWQRAAKYWWQVAHQPQDTEVLNEPQAQG